uniref:Alpha-carbonic anhydrase domain-containing protein n=1 Tax=Cynoglossus semilaevis TaxID=244447 RepID=A0A3P8WL70_CYNSE
GAQPLGCGPEQGPGSSGSLNQQHWSRKYPSCTSGRQSPVDIDEAFAPVRLQYQHLQLEGWERTIAESSTVHNNGKTVFVDVEGEFFVSGGGLSSRYRVSRVLFHWGRCNATSDGSEHSVNGQRSPLEVSRSSAQRGRGSLEAFTLGSLLPNNTDKYFIYNGSLTVPPCSEVVEWIVFKDRVDISETQVRPESLYHSLSLSLSLSDEVKMKMSFTPPCGLRNNHRLVHCHLPEAAGEGPEQEGVPDGRRPRRGTDQYCSTVLFRVFQGS